jgi:hypothetical protein
MHYFRTYTFSRSRVALNSRGPTTAILLSLNMGYYRVPGSRILEGRITFVTTLMKIGQMVQKLRYRETQTHTEHNDLI